MTSRALGLSSCTARPCHRLLAWSIPIVLAVSAPGQIWTKITPSDLERFDGFGYSVAIDGDTIAVGAVGDDGTGSAYVYRLAGGSWVQEAKLKPGNLTGIISFGYSIDLSDDTLVAGAPRGGSTGGRVFVFERSGTTWTEVAEFATGMAIGDNLGRTVAADGDTIAAGDTSDNSVAGAVYVYEKSGGSWQQSAKLTGPGGVGDVLFGESVDVSGDAIAVGAVGYNTYGTSSGDAFIYRRDATGWPLEVRLPASGVGGYSALGWSITMDGDRAAVASIRSGTPGSVFVFERNGGAWSQTTQITSTVARSSEHFGYAMDLRGKLLLVGSDEWTKSSPLFFGAGAAYLFEKTGSGWSEHPQLTEPDKETSEHFGFSVGVGTSYMVVGAPHDNLPSSTYSAGAIYVSGLGSDQQPPVVAMVSPGSGDVLSAIQTNVVVTVSDDSATTVTSIPAGLSGNLPGGGGVVTGTLPLDVEGPNQLTVSAIDAAGNVGGDSVTVIRDTLPPAVDVLSPAEGAVAGASPVEMTIDATDATATTIAFGGNAVPLPAGGGTAIGSVSLFEGVNPILVTATDSGGNQTQVTRTVILDLSAPLVTIDTPANGACFGLGEEDVSVAATVNDLSATTVSSVPAGLSASLPAGGGTASGTIALAEGANTITVTAGDATGRAGSDSITVVLDTTAPNVDLLAPLSGDVTRASIDVCVATSDPLPGSGIAQVEIRVDSTLVATLRGSPFEMILDTTSFGDGVHTLDATAVDGKGNAATASAQITVDNTAPNIAIITPVDGSFVSGTIDFRVDADDGGSGLVSVAMLAGGTPPTTDASATYDPAVAGSSLVSQENTTLRPDGTLGLTARAVDAAGNEAVALASVVVDNTAPEKSLVNPVDGSTVSGTIPIEATSSDPNLDTIAIRVDGVEIASSRTSPLLLSFDTTAMLDGSMVIEAVVRDLAGNEAVCRATVTVDNISVDLVPRSLSIRSKGTGYSIKLTLEGANVALAAPGPDLSVDLLVPGGSPVSAAEFSLGDEDADGIPDLVLRFSRQALIQAVQSGIAAGQIEPRSVIQVVVRARTISRGDARELGRAALKVAGGP